MFRTFALLILVAVVLCSGCSTPARLKRSTISIKDSQSTTLGTLFVWDNDVSAAVAYPGSRVEIKDGDRVFTRGPICMQRAMTAGATSVQASGSVSDALLQAAKLGTATGADLVAGSLAISSAVTALSVSTERTAFVDTTLFYLCQLEANGALDSVQMKDLIASLIDKSTAMAPATFVLPQAVGPDLGQDPAHAAANAAAMKVLADNAALKAERAAELAQKLMEAENVAKSASNAPNK